MLTILCKLIMLIERMGNHRKEVYECKVCGWLYVWQYEPPKGECPNCKD